MNISNFQLEAGAASVRDCGEDGKEEPDFIETHCHWIGCDKDYGTQDDLVKVRSNYLYPIVAHYLKQAICRFQPPGPSSVRSHHNLSKNQGIRTKYLV